VDDARSVTTAVIITSKSYLIHVLLLHVTIIILMAIAIIGIILIIKMLEVHLQVLFFLTIMNEWKLWNYLVDYEVQIYFLFPQPYLLNVILVLHFPSENYLSFSLPL